MDRGPIIVGVDGSATSRQALRWAAELAGLLGGEVVAVHAAGLLEAAHGEQAGASAARERAEAWCTRLAEAPVPHRLVVRDGSALDVLLAAIDDEGARLVVVGSRGTGGRPSRALGSTSLHLLQVAGVPVLVVPDHGGPVRPAALARRRILAGVDGSAHSLAALGVAAELADVGAAALTVLEVREFVPPFPPARAPVPAPPGWARLEDELGAIRRRGVHVQPVERSGQPVPTVLSVADELEVDLIVLGTRGRDGPEELDAGSVARQVADRARQPVLVVPSAAGTVHLRIDPPAVGERNVPLPDGRRLEVRPVRPGDVDGLDALYATLSNEDRYRRFFSSYTPDRAFFEHMSTVVARGGFGVVALDDDGHIVGEANYEPLPDGDGELGMVVDPAWRGWLGPYLLDTLVQAAHARGVPNIEADVLVTNGRMLSLLRARGYATLASGDWTSFRLIVGTAGDTPVWPAAGPGQPDASRPRVLVEAPGGRSSVGSDAEEQGLAVITCSGPKGPRSSCPALAGRPCPLAVGADAIVVANAPDDDRWRALIAAHAGLHPGVPVCVEPRGGPRLAVAVVERAAWRHRRAAAARRVDKQGGRSCTP